MPKPRSNPTNSLSLHETISSTLKRQHILGAVPAAMRFIPLGAFAAKELYERQIGKLETLSGPEEQILKLESAATVIDNPSSSTRLWSCAFCHPMHSKQSHVTLNSIFVSTATAIPGSKQHSCATDREINGCGAMRSPEG